MMKELLKLSMTIAVSFFVLAGAGIFTIWFWLNLF